MKVIYCKECREEEEAAEAESLQSQPFSSSDLHSSFEEQDSALICCNGCGLILVDNSTTYFRSTHGFSDFETDGRYILRKNDCFIGNVARGGASFKFQRELVDLKRQSNLNHSSMTLNSNRLYITTTKGKDLRSYYSLRNNFESILLRQLKINSIEIKENVWERFLSFQKKSKSSNSEDESECEEQEQEEERHHPKGFKIIGYGKRGRSLLAAILYLELQSRNLPFGAVQIMSVFSSETAGSLEKGAFFRDVQRAKYFLEEGQSERAEIEGKGEKTMEVYIESLCHHLVNFNCPEEDEVADDLGDESGRIDAVGDRVLGSSDRSAEQLEKVKRLKALSITILQFVYLRSDTSRIADSSSPTALATAVAAVAFECFTQEALEKWRFASLCGFLVCSQNLVRKRLVAIHSLLLDLAIEETANGKFSPAGSTNPPYLKSRKVSKLFFTHLPSLISLSSEEIG